VAVLVWLAVLASGSASAGTPITAIAFSPDGSFLLTSGYRKVVIESVGDRIRRAELKCDFPKINALSFSPDGQFLAVGGGTPGDTGAVMLFARERVQGQREDMASRLATKLVSHRTAFDDVVTSVAFSPDRTKLAVASADGSVDIMAIGDAGFGAKPRFTLAGHSGPVLGVAFSPAGTILVTASADRSLRVWNSENGQPLRAFSHHTAIIHCVIFRPPPVVPGEAGLASCASGSDDKSVRVWQPEIGRMVRIVRSHEGAILALAYSLDGSKLFSAGSEGIIRIIDSESDSVRQQLKAHEDWIYAMALSPDGQTLATGDWAGTVKLWNVRGENAPIEARALRP